MYQYISVTEIYFRENGGALGVALLGGFINISLFMKSISNSHFKS